MTSNASNLFVLLLVLPSAVFAATGPAANGRAVTPPMGWRHWNQWNGGINQDIIEGNIRALADRSRLINGKLRSLADIGYSDAGIDDGWQKCGHFGPDKYRYHSALGAPVIDDNKFTDLAHVTKLAHSFGMTAGWYGNACGCVDGCCSDHCDTLECFVGDVDATLAFGFDSYKIDGCGAQRDIEFWATLFNHSIENRRKTHVSPPGPKLGMMLENCHDDDGMKRGNSPYYDDHGELWCPFHTYRTSGDARPTFGSLLNNLNSTRALAAANLSLPGCWAYPDMMEVGVTATGGLSDCGSNGTSVCVPLSVAESRSHFGAWAIVSSPLTLSFDLRNSTMLDLQWDTITNTDAIEINQDYAGHSGAQFAASETNVTLHGCDWKAGVSCEWPSWIALSKPLSRRDARKSVAAVLVINNDAEKSVSGLGFLWADVPGLVKGGADGDSTTAAVSSCVVYDVWGRKDLGRMNGAGYKPSGTVAAHDSIFVTLSDCN